MFNTIPSIDDQMQAILAKQEFLVRLQAEQVAQILRALKNQVERNLQLRELLVMQVATGEQGQHSATQEIGHMDSSVTLAVQEPDAFITQGSMDSADAKHADAEISKTAQSVPLPCSLDPLKQSTEAFPMEDSLRQTVKHGPTCASMMDKLKAWGASASTFLNSLLNHRSSSCVGTFNPTDVNTGGETIEEGGPQESQQSGEKMAKSVNNVGAVLIGSVAIGKVSSAAKPKKQVAKRSNTLPKLFRKKTSRGKIPRDAPKDCALDQVTTREMGPAGFLMSPTFSRQYKLGRVLGEGGFGVVMAATRLTDGRQVAIKFINTAEVPCDRWLPDSRSPTGVLVPSEIAILQQLRHPNIIQYIDHMVEENKCFLLITELHGSEWQRSPSSAEPCSSSAPTDDARGGKLAPMDLFACLEMHHHLPEPVARTIFSQIVLGVQHLQLNGLVHRDIKDENIVIDSNYSVKIIDFGSAAYIPRNEGEHFAQFLGTALYGSPEIIKGETCGGPEAEIWALGVLLFIMVFGESPFQNEAQIAEGTVRMPKGFHLESDRDYHDGCRNLLRSMLQYTPECRITIDEVLQHGWLKNEVKFYQDAYHSCMYQP